MACWSSLLVGCYLVWHWIGLEASGPCSDEIFRWMKFQDGHYIAQNFIYLKISSEHGPDASNPIQHHAR